MVKGQPGRLVDRRPLPAAPGTAARPAWSAGGGTAAPAPSQAVDSAAVMVKGQPGRLVDRCPLPRRPWDRRPPCLVGRQGDGRPRNFPGGRLGGSYGT
jgi:hypothetical protein